MCCCVSTVQWLRERATKLFYTTFFDNTEHFYIVDGYVYVSNNKKRDCCVSTVQWLRERATKLLYTTLPFLMRNKIAVCVAVGENRGLRLECGVALHVDTFH